MIPLSHPGITLLVREYFRNFMEFQDFLDFSAPDPGKTFLRRKYS
jgi:hypothetical protein